MGRRHRLRTNAATVPYDVVLTSVLPSVKHDLMRIEAVEHFLERYNGKVDAAVAAAEERRANLAAAAQRLDEQIARLVDAIADGAMRNLGVRRQAAACSSGLVTASPSRKRTPAIS
jgi:hypothetical protein